MFARSKFRGYISQWNVGRVKNFCRMFAGSCFDGDISNWDVSHATSMDYMFSCSQFNQDISRWNVAGVNHFFRMFDNCQFRQDISSWNYKDDGDYDSFCFPDWRKQPYSLGFWWHVSHYKTPNPNRTPWITADDAQAIVQARKIGESLGLTEMAVVKLLYQAHRHKHSLQPGMEIDCDLFS